MHRVATAMAEIYLDHCIFGRYSLFMNMCMDLKDIQTSRIQTECVDM